MKEFISRFPLLKWLFKEKEEEPLSFLSLDEQKSYIERHKALKPGEIMEVSPSEMAFYKQFTENEDVGYVPLANVTNSGNGNFAGGMRYPHSSSGISELFYDGKNVVDEYGISAGINCTADYKNCVAIGYNLFPLTIPLDQQKFIVGEQCLAITGISDNERQRLENARRFPSRIYIPNGGLSYCYSSASIKKWMKWQERLRKAREAKKLKKENANKKPTS